VISIYKVTNKTNGKVYIGKTIWPIEKRWKDHCKYARLKCTNQAIHRAIRKYGTDNFSLRLEATVSDAKLGSEIEQAYIAFYKANQNGIGYNLTQGGEGLVGFRHTKASKEKMSRSQKAKKVVGFWKGKHHSEQSKEKLRKAHTIPLPCKEVCLMYSNGLSLKKIAEKFGTSTKPIWHTLEKCGVRRRPAGVLKGQHLSEEHRKSIGLGSARAWHRKRLSERLTVNTNDSMAVSEI
jgi:group I intron endonuclease